MKVSVIIPVYNSEKFLRPCLDSVIAQTLSDFEIIIINDGSTDSSADIINEYVEKHPGKVLCITVENGGQGRAKNFGIDIACGDYILNIDSDDTICPEMLEKMYNKAIGENADVVICDFYRVTDGEKTYESALLTPHPLSAIGQCWNKLIKKSLIGDIRYPEGIWYEDSAFSGQILIKSEKTVFLKEALYNYNIGHPSTMRNKNAKKNLDIIPVLDSIKACAESCGKEIDFDFLVLTHVVLEAVKRVSPLKTAEAKAVLKELLDYAHREIPDISKSGAFKIEPRNRRIIMWLNYHRLYGISNLILKVK